MATGVHGRRGSPVGRWRRVPVVLGFERGKGTREMGQGKGKGEKMGARFRCETNNNAGDAGILRYYGVDAVRYEQGRGRYCGVSAFWPLKFAVFTFFLLSS